VVWLRVNKTIYIYIYIDSVVEFSCRPSINLSVEYYIWNLPQCLPAMSCIIMRGWHLRGFSSRANSDRCLSAKLVLTFEDIGCCVATATDPPWTYSRFSFEPGTSGSVARSPDHWTTEAVYFLLIQFVPHRKHNTSPLCSQELWPLDHRGGLLSST
jgi:hypothetical protein